MHAHTGLAGYSVTARLASSPLLFLRDTELNKPHVHLGLSQLWCVRDALGGAGGLGQQGSCVPLQLLGVTPMDVHGTEEVPPQT